MIIVTIPLRDYTVSLSYLVQLAGEFGGKTMSATIADDDAEFGWEGPSAPVHSKAFRTAVDSSFKRRDPNAPPDPDGSDI